MTHRLEHGGDPSAAAKRFGTPDGGWLDLSTGINPTPYPLPNIPLQAWQRLPTHAEEQELLSAVRQYLQIPPNVSVVAAPGTQAIIQWLPRLRPSGPVDVVAPTYGEHAACWRSAGHTVRTIPGLEHADADVVVIVNPNNPTGQKIPKQEILAGAERQAERGGWLVVDEAFADVCPAISVAADVERDGLVVLRSFGKFFGLAGLRLGLALAAPTITDRLQQALGPWAVPGPALIVGAQAYRDIDWQNAMRKRLRSSAERLDGLLVQTRANVLGGTDLFRLVQTDAATTTFDQLALRGVYVRTFTEHPSWLRFGLPGPEDDWSRLERALLD